VPSRRYLFTSESVTEGHPDKIADQISDAVLDAVYAQDPYGRVACETIVTTGLAFIAGEITTRCYVDIPKVARGVIRDVGYTRAKYGFDYETCAVITAIQEQSADIALGVDIQGAGDQGLMFGYATTETPELMPMPIMLAHKLVMRLTEVRRKEILEYLRPDGKSQVTVEYTDGKPTRVDTVVVSAQHSPEVTLKQIREDIIETVILPVLPPELLDPEKITYPTTSTRPAASSSAGRTGTPASRGARSSWTPTGGSEATGAAATPARTRRRWTGRPPTWPATSPRTWWRPGSARSARCSWPMPSAWRSRFPSWWTASGPGASRTRCCRTWRAATSS